YDLVGNNMPVFFIQDAMKFPDLIHAVKPEPNNEIPQAASAHDTFWDFVVNTPETLHNVMWLMSPRAVPRSFRMMEGFGIHTFRLVNAAGEFKFVKFHWKPLLGVHSLVWDEAQKIAGKDGDFNRRDLWNSIECGCPAEYELGIQVLEPGDEFAFDFDILDATKLWPEELVPLRRVGKLTLNQNVTNFFAETEQVAFCPANIVPGIDFSNDPLLQGRIFSYLDTQLSRLGGPNFHQIPINRPLAPINNNQRDGMHQMNIDEGQTSYHPNALNRNEPHSAGQGAPETHESYFEHLRDHLDGGVIRERSESFRDHYSQPAMFWNSMSAFEKKHIIDAFRFELGKCMNKNTRQLLVDHLAHIHGDLARAVGEGLGLIPAQARAAQPNPAASPALSMENSVQSAKTRRVAILAAQGFDKAQLDAMTAALCAAGAQYDLVSFGLGPVAAADGCAAESGQTFATASSVLYDAVFVPGGPHTAALRQSGDAMQFIAEAYRHFKTIGLEQSAAGLLPLAEQSPPADSDPKAGVIIDADMAQLTECFVTALARGKHYGRAGAVLSA
ncbi:MAG: catalase, partial [Oscillospiraceae bacterium]|nr:catalase [Oscillospiraceae bacterium]